jgi:hypothetical protein
MGVSYMIRESYYLDTDYQPDCEYAGTILIDGNVGEKNIAGSRRRWVRTSSAGGSNATFT